jgi:hypothetical protein
LECEGFLQNRATADVRAFIEKEMERHHGKFEWFYPDGKLKQKASYSLGKQVGEDFQHYQNGQLDTYRKFDDRGLVVGEVLFQENGNKSVFEIAEFQGGANVMCDILKRMLNVRPGDVVEKWLSLLWSTRMGRLQTSKYWNGLTRNLSTRLCR